jgi:Organic solute transporter Ostalpha
MSTIRDFYEAFVIASFVYYLIELLGGQDSLVDLLRRKPPRYGKHTFPLNRILQDWELGAEFMLQCKHGVLQYVVFKTTATVLTFVCEFAGVYGEGRFSWFVAYPYLCFFQNISVMYALYCLVMLFHAVNDELRHPINWHPLGKFLCIKGVVFFTWWQGVLIFYLRDHGIIDSMGSWSSQDVANGLIDYCIVVEMVGFSIAHSYTFTYTEYQPGRFPSPTSSTDGQNGVSDDAENDNSPNYSNDDIIPGESNLRRSSSSSSYRPPATLPRPMSFRDALWSSTVPRETLQDIQRLRSGIDTAISDANRPRSLSLQEINRSEDVNHDTAETLVPPPDDGTVLRGNTADV